MYAVRSTRDRIVKKGAGDGLVTWIMRPSHSTAICQGYMDSVEFTQEVNIYLVQATWHGANAKYAQ